MILPSLAVLCHRIVIACADDSDCGAAPSAVVTMAGAKDRSGQTKELRRRHRSGGLRQRPVVASSNHPWISRGSTRAVGKAGVFNHV
jgi:hypothetical protein